MKPGVSINRCRQAAACAAVVMVVATAAGALAQPGSVSRIMRGEPDPPEGYQPRLSAATGQLCVKQCPADDLPCDPPAFKIADGRCTTQWR